MNAYARLMHSARLVDALRPWVLYPCLVLLALSAGFMLILQPHHLRVGPFAFADVFCWALVGSRLLLVQRALRHARMPRDGRSIGHAFALLAVPTIVLPTLVLAIIHQLTLEALSLLLLWNVAGLLWALGPVPVAMAVNLTPALMWAPHWFHSTWPRMPQAAQELLLPPLVLALAAYLARLWRAGLMREVDDFRPLSMPWVLRFGGQSWFDGSARAVATRQMLQRMDARMAQQAHALRFDAGDPAQRIRNVLGPPYAFVSRRESRKSIAIYLAFGLIGVLGGWLLHWQADGTVMALLGVAAMLSSLPIAAGTLSQRLKTFPGVLAELALLPGLGSTVQARRHVLRATLGAGQRRFALLALGAMLLAYALGAPAMLLAMMLALVVLAWVGNIALVLGAWALRPESSTLRRALLVFGGFALIQLVGPIAVVVIASPAGMGIGLYRAIILVLGSGWVIAIAALLTRFVLDWRRFRRCSHPFLQR